MQKAKEGKNSKIDEIEFTKTFELLYLELWLKIIDDIFAFQKLFDIIILYAKS